MYEAPQIDLSKIVRCYGSFTALAKRLGIPLTTVHGWKLRDNVPDWRADKIKEIAKEDGHKVVYLPRRRRTKKTVQ